MVVRVRKKARLKTEVTVRREAKTRAIADGGQGQLVSADGGQGQDRDLDTRTNMVVRVKAQARVRIKTTSRWRSGLGWKSGSG